jgi:hypothetical protein
MGQNNQRLAGQPQGLKSARRKLSKAFKHIDRKNGQNLFLGSAIGNQLLDGSLDSAPCTARPAKIQIEQGGVGYAEMSEQAPEMLNMTPAKRCDGDERLVDQDILGRRKLRHDDLFGIAFDQQHESRKVQFRKRQNGLAHEFAGFFVILWQLDGPHGRFAHFRIGAAIADLFRFDTAQHRGRMAGDQRLRGIRIDQRPDLADDSRQIVRR